MYTELEISVSEKQFGGNTKLTESFYFNSIPITCFQIFENVEFHPLALN